MSTVLIPCRGISAVDSCSNSIGVELHQGKYYYENSLEMRTNWLINFDVRKIVKDLRLNFGGHLIVIFHIHYFDRQKLAVDDKANQHQKYDDSERNSQSFVPTPLNENEI